MPSRVQKEQEDMSFQDPDKEYGLLLERQRHQYDVECLVGETPEIIEDYDKYSMEELKAKLSEKVQETIYQSTIKTLKNERIELDKQKNNFLNRLLGRTQLKEAKTKNIDAQIGHAIQRRKAKNDSVTVERMIIDMYEHAYKHNGGEMPQEMVELETAIREVFTDLPDSEQLQEQMNLKSEKGMISLSGKRKLFGLRSNRKEAERINADTANIEEQIQEEQNKKNEVTRDATSMVLGVYAEYSEVLQKFGNLWQEPSIEQEQELEIVE